MKNLAIGFVCFFILASGVRAQEYPVYQKKPTPEQQASRRRGIGGKHLDAKLHAAVGTDLHPANDSHTPLVVLAMGLAQTDNFADQDLGSDLVYAD